MGDVGMLGAEGFLADGEGALGHRNGFLVPPLLVELENLLIEMRCCFEVALLREAEVGDSQEDEKTKANGPGKSPYPTFSTRVHLPDLLAEVGVRGGWFRS